MGLGVGFRICGSGCRVRGSGCVVCWVKVSGLGFVVVVTAAPIR